MYNITPPSFEPVTVDDAKRGLRIDDDRFDDVLPGLISAARDIAEQETGRKFVEQTWRTELADWPARTDVINVYRPTAAAVAYWNGSAWATVPTTDYGFAASGSGAVLAPAIGLDWPALGSIAIGPRVRIDLTAGLDAADAAYTPECVRTFIVAVVGQLVQTPELTAAGAVQHNPLLSRLLDSQRLFS